jgi:hypothetical protein
MTTPEGTPGPALPGPHSGSGPVLLSPGSIERSSHILLEVAGLLEAGAPDLGTGSAAAWPYAHQEVGTEVRVFTTFCEDQYRNATGMIAALSTKLDDAVRGFVALDASAAARVNAFLRQTEYVPPEDGA